MYRLQIHVQCYDRFSEVLPDEVESVELLVEDVVSHVLLDLFGSTFVDEVTIKPTSSEVLVRCESDIDQSKQGNMETAKRLVETVVDQALRELFGTVTVNEVTIKTAPSQYEQD